MPTFQYTYRDQSGKLQTGVKDADNQNVLTRQLREQGFAVTRVQKVKAAARPGQKAQAKPKGMVRGGVKLTELSVFCRQFSTMIDAGVSLVRCLSVLQEQATSSKLKRITSDIQSEVEAGNSLSKAMTKYPRVFSNLFIGLIKAGEVGGVLEESLQRLSSFLEKDVELRRKVKAAMTYPTIVMGVAVLIVVGLVTFVLPKFFKLFEELGVKDFPVMTLFLKNCSDFLVLGFPMRQVFIGAGIFAIIFAFKMFVRTKFGKRLYDRFKLKVPVFGSLNHKIALARFSRTLGTLLVSGVPILQAMETVAGTVDNDILSEAIMNARARIREGDSIGVPLKKSGLFPPMVVQMISIGEESGALDSMLTKVAEFYEQEVDSALESLTSAIEPLMIVFLGGAVGFIVVAMFMPMISIIQNLSGGGDEAGKE